MQFRIRRPRRKTGRHGWSRTRTPAGWARPMRRSSAGSAKCGSGCNIMLALPKSRAEIESIQSRRKRRAVEQARRAPFYAGKLDAIDLHRLDDPDEWRKIPIL